MSKSPDNEGGLVGIAFVPGDVSPQAYTACAEKAGVIAANATGEPVTAVDGLTGTIRGVFEPSEALTQRGSSFAPGRTVDEGRWTKIFQHTNFTGTRIPQ